ncbi:MAG: hypothetical protein IJ394_02255 [Bacteroidales bacterium]|nr:hypothetical protein [Bacteroidales bacterium]
MVIRLTKIILVTLLLVSCVSNKTSSDVVCHELESYQVIGTYDVEELGTIIDVSLFQEYLIVNSINTDTYFHVIDSNTGEIVTDFGFEGRGPAEFINVGRQISICDSLLYISDNGQKKLYAININSALRSEPAISWSMDYPYTRDFRPNKFMVMNDKTICLGAIKDFRFGVLNNTTGQIESHDIHYMPVEEGVEDIYIGSVYQSLFRANPQADTFVISLLASDYFEIYNISDNKVQCLFTSADSQIPQLHVKPRMGTKYAIDYDRSIAGNIDLTVNAERIFFLYSEEPYSKYAAMEETDNVRVYDWKGNHIENYKLPIPVSKIVATKDGLLGFKDIEDKIVICCFDI